MDNKEIEFKVMVNAEELQKVKVYLSNFQHHNISQINYYYDTIEMSLRKQKISLRTRYIENEDKYILTLKEPLKEGRLEHEEYIQGKDISLCSNEIKNLLLKYRVTLNELIEIASLQTDRTEYLIDGNIVCLDHSMYYGTEDFEIECESNNMFNAQEQVFKILNHLNIPIRESKYTKIARAIKKKLNLND